MQDTEKMLAIAGFRAAPAMTLQTQKQLALLPLLGLMMRPRRIGNATEVGYAGADPVAWHCVFDGASDDFAPFQQLAIQRRLTDQYTAAAEMQQASDFSWGGPGVWFPGPTGVVHDHDHDDRTIDAPAPPSRLQHK